MTKSKHFHERPEMAASDLQEILNSQILEKQKKDHEKDVEQEYYRSQYEEEKKKYEEEQAAKRLQDKKK